MRTIDAQAIEEAIDPTPVPMMKMATKIRLAIGWV